MEKRKILLVTSGFPFGNTERGFLTTEFRHLAETFDVSILSIGSREPILYPIPESIPVERYAYPPFMGSLGGTLLLLRNSLRPRVLREMLLAAKGRSLSQLPELFKQILAYWCNALFISQRIEAYIKEGKADLIYTYWCTEATLAGALLKRKYPQVRLLTRFHGHDLFHDRRETNWQPFRPLIAGEADALVFACKAGLDYFLSTWGRQYEEKSLLCYLGCAPAARPPKAPSETLRLVSCSNLIPLKRVEHIIEGISRLPGDLSIRWEHFGNGPEREKLEAQAEKQLGPNVSWKFHGHVPNHQIAQLYARLDPELFLTTSSTEGGVPVSLQESLSMGIPVIGTDVGGIPDLVIPGRSGYLLPGKNCAEELARAIMDYVNLSSDQKQELSDSAYRLWTEEFNAEHNSAAFMQVLSRLLDK